MPYIKDADKNEMSDAIEKVEIQIESKGDLTYVICELAGRLIIDCEKLSYTEMSKWINAVHDAETELRRRILNQYEDIKILENGDVPSFKGINDRLNGSY